ncbi:MAG TPA: stage III sporulation protein AC [Anaerovoracaceae bacterium]|nr:stage III sporulation protein AC [Anaerovoracaceae bacterium]
MDINVDIIFKIAAIGIIVAVLNQVLIRAGREDQAMMTTLAGIIVVLLLIVQMINDFFITVKTLFQL